MNRVSVLPQPPSPRKTPAPAPPAVLPLWGAFVVQFRAEAEVFRGQWVGRVEHVRSGQTTHFDSLDDLRTFIARLLTAMRSGP